MARPPLEVADVLAAHARAFFEARSGIVSSAKRRVVRKLVTCRTAALGGHIDRCDRCDYERVSYNSCRNRHCPKCQAAARAEWLEAREADLLPVEYFHVVFTVPAGIAEITLQNKKIMYAILLRASAETVQQIAGDPKHLGARIGLLSVLHTWGQNLLHHPHVHCVVPGGGLSPDGNSWVSCRPGFFLPVGVLSKVFRGKFLDMTRHAFANGELSFQGALAPLNDAHAFATHLKTACETDWVVYAKPPFGGPAQVLKYLARYTHRIAISNHRLVSLENGRIKFRWKDYAHGNRHRTMTLDAGEFIRRFLLHVLPKGFMRIRHFGFLANACRTERLRRCRELLGCSSPTSVVAEDANDSLDDDKLRRCPSCSEGHLIRRELPPFHPDLAPRPVAKPPPALAGTP